MCVDEEKRHIYCINRAQLNVYMYLKKTFLINLYNLHLTKQHPKRNLKIKLKLKQNNKLVEIRNCIETEAFVCKNVLRANFEAFGFYFNLNAIDLIVWSKWPRIYCVDSRTPFPFS